MEILELVDRTIMSYKNFTIKCKVNFGSKRKDNARLSGIQIIPQKYNPYFVPEDDEQMILNKVQIQTSEYF